MIVRLMGEGQYRIDEGVRSRLNELDDKAMQALERNDEAELDGYLDQMGKIVRGEGTALELDDLHPSDLLIPPSDLTLEETRQLFSEDGLIPDLPIPAA
ncbi:MAG: hypothetical protein H0T39_05665 [Actinobacteria bacterium]|nr:hypothetical protein [Actinomycetota bacterium]